MKLRTRLTIASAAITAISTLLIGGFAVNSSYNSGVALLDKSLNAVATSARGHTNAALSEALYSVQQSDIALTLVYYSGDKKASILNQSKLSVVPNPSAAQIKKSLSGPFTVKGPDTYRMRTINLGDGEYLVVAGSLHDINKRYRNDMVHLALFLLLCLIAAGIATWIIVRRDMKRIESLIAKAGQISSGDMDVHIASPEGKSEIDNLAESLNKMVMALRRTAQVEEEASRRMQDFLGDASHELRTPLTVVKGYVELLAGSGLNEPAKRARVFERVGSEIHRMENLISDLLFLAEFGDMPSKEFVSLDLSELVRSHVMDFSLLNPDRPLETKIEDSVYIEGSVLHMSRLVTNVLANVSRHTPAEAPVRVSLNRQGEAVELIIEDGGPGLPEGAYKDGMQSFQRFDKARTREHGGSGLGMSIIFAIVREHAGKINLGSSDLGGLKVRILFGNFDE